MPLPRGNLFFPSGQSFLENQSTKSPASVVFWRLFDALCRLFGSCERDYQNRCYKEKNELKRSGLSNLRLAAILPFIDRVDFPRHSFIDSVLD